LFCGSRESAVAQLSTLGGMTRMTIYEMLFDILVGVPLLLLWCGGWSALTFYVLRCRLALPWSGCVAIALFVGVAFNLFLFRFTAAVPSSAMIPMTPEQRTISRIGYFLVCAPWGAFLLLVAFRYLSRRSR
jgi:hypothetical protein